MDREDTGGWSMTEITEPTVTKIKVYTVHQDFRPTLTFNMSFKEITIRRIVLQINQEYPDIDITKYDIRGWHILWDAEEE